MPDGPPPAVARRHVRTVSRKTRKALHLTQAEVAEATDWSLPKVQRIEKGDVTIAVNDLRPLLRHFGIDAGNRSNPEENAVLYRESGEHDDILEDAAQVRRHRAMFDRWWHSSYDEEKSVRLIGDHAA